MPGCITYPKDNFLGSPQGSKMGVQSFGVILGPNTKKVLLGIKPTNDHLAT